MSEQLIPCMGGWCARRESCGHYHAGTGQEPAERLCFEGDRDVWVPVNFQRQDPQKEAA